MLVRRTPLLASLARHVLVASTRVAPLACQSLRRLGDCGQPVVVSEPDAATAQAFVTLEACIAAQLVP
jgi:hypothetical protein